MNAHRVHPWLVPALALTLALAACNRSDTASERMASRTPTSPSATPTAPAAPAPAAQPSDPSATSTASGANSSETAKSTDKPMSSMDKNEESKSMPQPGQANDHSTLAQDPKAPK